MAAKAGKPKRQVVDWDRVRQDFELGGSTISELARRHGVDKAAVSRKAKKDNWIQDVNGAVDRLTTALVNGVVNTVDSKKRAEGITAAAERKLQILEIHKRQWEQHRQHIENAVSAADFEAAKLAKITAETLKIVQDGERQAWGIRKDDAPPTATDPIKDLFREIAEAERGRRLPVATSSSPGETVTDDRVANKTGT